MLVPRMRRSRGTVNERRPNADRDRASRRGGDRPLARLAEARRGVRPARGQEHPHLRQSRRPEEGAVVMDIPDMDAVMSYMQTQDAADAMAHDGVLPETLVFLVEQ